MIQNCLNFWTYFMKFFEILTFRGKKGAFFEETVMKNIHFSRGFKKTWKCSSFFQKKILRLWKSRTKKIKCCEKTFISKVFEKKNWPKKSKFKFCASQIIAIFGRLGILSEKYPSVLEEAKGSRVERPKK